MVEDAEDIVGRNTGVGVKVSVWFLDEKAGSERRCTPVWEKRMKAGLTESA